MTQVGSVSEKDCHAVMMECTLTFCFAPLSLKIHLDVEGGNGSWTDWEGSCSSPCGPGNLGRVENIISMVIFHQINSKNIKFRKDHVHKKLRSRGILHGGLPKDEILSRRYPSHR